MIKKIDFVIIYLITNKNNKMNLNNLRIIFLHNLKKNKYHDDNDNEPKYYYSREESSKMINMIDSNYYQGQLSKYINNDNELKEKFKNITDSLHKGGLGRHGSVYYFDFKYHGVKYEDERYDKESRKMFNEHTKIYEKWINHWNKGNFYQIRLMKTFSIDHNNLLSVPEIYCSRIKLKLKEELDILNYKESLIENQIKILDEQCLINSDEFENKLLKTDKYKNDKKNEMTLYDLSHFITKELLENGYIKDRKTKNKEYNTKCTSCDILKDFVENHNKNDKIKYIEKITDKSGLFCDKNKICTVEIID